MKNLSKKLAALFFAILLTASVLTPAATNAVNVETPAQVNELTPSVVVSAFGGTSSLDFAELFNQSDKPVNISGWSFSFTVHDNGGICADETFATKSSQSGWLLPGSYFSFEPGTSNDVNEAFFTLDKTPSANCISPQLTKLQLINSQSQAAQTINIPSGASGNAWVHHQRGNKSPARTLDGNFVDDYAVASTIKCQVNDPDEQITICSQPLYNSPASVNGLQIVEILPHSQDCSPADYTSPDCADYVKIFVPNSVKNSLQNYRLRIGSKGQNATASNTFDLGAYPLTGNFLTVSQKEDGSALSIADLGGYAWLEDAAGIKIYNPVIKYPSATSITKIGEAYAYDGQSWQWTTTPEPFGANKITKPQVGLNSSNPNNASSLKPCAADQFRNPLTNRCKLKVSTDSGLVACQTGQLRNPATNRCKSILAANTNLKPCAADQFRNPLTNRCKSKVNADTLKPCQPGWRRNPATNRCRKSSAGSVSDPKIKDVKSDQNASSHTGWIIGAAAIVLALAYAAAEWRQEIWQKLTATISRFKAHG